MAFLTFASLVVACIAVSTRAAPTHDEHLMMSLDQVMNNSVCPIHVHYDEDEHRVPRRIKMLKCAARPHPMCASKHMPHACCHTSLSSVNMQCVEVTDKVLVRYTNRGDDAKLELLKVSVGCSCMIRKESEANE